MNHEIFRLAACGQYALGAQTFNREEMLLFLDAATWAKSVLEQQNKGVGNVRNCSTLEIPESSGRDNAEWKIGKQSDIDSAE